MSRSRLVISALGLERVLRNAAGLGLACFLLAPDGVAQARFEVPGSCGTEAAFRRQLELLAGNAVPANEPSALQIRKQGSGYRLHLEFAGEVRELVDPDCPTLLRSAVVITAAAARAKSGTSEGPAPEAPEAAPAGPATAAPLPSPPEATPTAPAEPAPAATPSVAPAPAPAAEPAAPALPALPQQRPPGALPAPAPLREPAAAPAAAAPARTAAPVRFGVGAGIGVSGGVVPGASAAFELRAGLEPAPVGAALSAVYWPGRSTDRQGRGLDVSALGVRASALVSLAAPVRAGLGLEVDRLSGTGSADVPGRGSDTAWRVAGSLELNAIPWSIDRLRLELGALAQLALMRPRFVITGFGDVYRVPQAGGAAIIRVVWLFP